MIILNRETFLVCFIKDRLYNRKPGILENAYSTPFTPKDIDSFRIKLTSDYEMTCPYNIGDIIEIVLQYTELFVNCGSIINPMFNLRWDEIHSNLDRHSLIEYLLSSFGISSIPSEVKEFLYVNSTSINNISSDIIMRLIDSYEGCKLACILREFMTKDEILHELSGTYNEAIVQMALKYTRSEK